MSRIFTKHVAGLKRNGLQQIKFADMQVILVDGQRNFRYLLQNALHAVGFGDIQGVGRIEDLSGSVPPDGAIKQIHTFLTQIERIVAEEKLSNVNRIVVTTRKVLNGIVGNPGKPKARQFEALRLYGQAIAAPLRNSDNAAGSLVSELDDAPGPAVVRAIAI